MNCKHGVEAATCSNCLQDPRNFLPKQKPELRQDTGDGKKCFQLDPPGADKTVRVLAMEPELRWEKISVDQLEDVQITKEEGGEIRRILLDRIRARKSGTHLTQRERTKEGPPHCRACKTELSYERQDLQCLDCESYLCRCGTCMCGWDGGWNYLKQFIPPQPAQKVDRRLRACGVLANLSFSFG